ncbi:TonB-dependent receptor [Prolixibacteraceae bacterium JC049]|nr:TonB-dependent receptor [Prolixibacteraceae bacterium JC049]
MKKILFIAFLFLSLISWGQKITGKVVEAEDKPLVGAAIFYKDTSIGTTTDENGEFTIDRSDVHHELIVRFVGYETQQFCTHAMEGDELHVVMKPNAELEEVVVAKRQKGNILDSKDPIQSQRITGAELGKAACCNLSESFETNASVDVANADAATGAKSIKLLGLTGKYIETMTEKNPNFRGIASAYGMQYIPGPWLESIHVSKGVGSVINGFESITGQINVEYHKPQRAPKLFFNAYHNSMGMSETNLVSGIKVSPTLSTAVLGHFQDNRKEIDHNNDGFLDDPMVKQYNFFNRWLWTPGENYRTQFGIKIIDEERIGGQTNYNTSLPNTKDNRYRINIETQRVEGFWKMGYILPNDRNSSFGFISNFAHHKQRSFYGLRNYDANQTYFYGNLLFQSYLGNTNHRYTAGVSFIYDNFDDRLEDTEVLTTNRTEKIGGAYLEYTWTPSEEITLQTGLRYDNHSQFGSFVTPRLHFKYQLTPETALRISGGNGRRTANPIAENSFLLASNRKFKITDDLKQEKAWNFGLSLTHQFEMFGRPFTFVGDVYRTQFENQVIVDVVNDLHAVSFYNLDGKSYANNYQAELKFEPIERLDVTTAIRFSDVKADIGDEFQRVPFVNRYKGLMSLSYATSNNSWQFDFTTQLNGDMKIPSTATNPVEFQRKSKSPVYAVVNTQITKRFKRLELYAGIENLGNYRQKNPIISAENPFSDYFDASLVWGPIQERKFYAGLRFTIE